MKSILTLAALTGALVARVQAILDKSEFAELFDRATSSPAVRR